MMDRKEKIIFILRIILLILLISFFIIFIRTDKTNCEVCSFDIDGKQMSAIDFYNEYSSMCFYSKPLNPFNLTTESEIYRES